MAHPRMYDDADPLLGELRRRCTALPETVEQESWASPYRLVAPATLVRRPDSAPAGGAS